MEGDPYWRKPADVWASSDEGANWRRVAQIARPTEFNGIEYEWWYATYALHRLPDNTLLWPVQLRNTVNTKPPYTKVLAMYHSSDAGKSWQGPSPFADWSSEGGMTRTPTGKLLAAVRYQRQLLPDDPPDLCDGRTWGGCKYYPWLERVPYKHVFLIESHDDGRTWTNFRQVTTSLGQCFAFPTALPDGTVVLVHTTAYGPGSRGSRAMISHDEGNTWQDEAYYLTFSEPSGYNQSVALKDGAILTVAARNDDEPLTAIRWRPVKRENSKHEPEAQTNWSPAKRERMKVVRRQRRIIFNDDLYELDREDAGTPQGFLKGRLQPLVGTQVDTISFSVIEADAPVYDSKVQPIYGDAHGGPPPYWPNIGPNIKALARQGHCPIQIITDFAHEHGMESWAHVRMNDVHDSFLAGWLSLWKKKHPELLVDTDGMLTDKKLYVTANDFSHEECRRRKLEIIEEIAGQYDVDGFELDYIRHPVLFSRTMRGQSVTSAEVQIMTSLMGRIRQLTDAAAARRGRPIVIAVRVPDTLSKSLSIGLDVKRWVEGDLIDMLIIGGGYAPFTLDVAEYIEIARPRGVPVYPCINAGKVRDDTLVTERALASRWYRDGADGIYTWNLGTPFEYKTGEDLIETRGRSYACLYEIGDPKTLVGKDKLYRSESGPVYHHYNFVSGIPPLPLTIKPGTSQYVELRVGDAVETAAQAGILGGLSLELYLTGNVDDNKLSTTLNGQRLDRSERIVLNAADSTFMIRYQFTAPLLNAGRNIIGVSLSREGRASDETVTLRELRLSVDYR